MTITMMRMLATMMMTIGDADVDRSLFRESRHADERGDADDATLRNACEAIHAE